MDIDCGLVVFDDVGVEFEFGFVVVGEGFFKFGNGGLCGVFVDCVEIVEDGLVVGGVVFFYDDVLLGFFVGRFFFCVY